MATIYNIFSKMGHLVFTMANGELIMFSSYQIGKKIFIPEDLPIDEDYLMAELSDEQKKFWQDHVVIGNPFATVAGYNCQN